MDLKERLFGKRLTLSKQPETKIMQIIFQGQYDRDLFFKAVALANRPPKNRQRLLSFLLVIAIGSLGVVTYRIITSGDLLGNVVYLAAAIFMGGFVGQIFLRPYFAARKLWESPGTQRPLKGTITDQGITYVLPEGENFIPWARFNRLQKTDDLLTLVRNDGLLLVFPQGFFKSQSEWQKFNKLVNSKVSPIDEKGIQRPVRSK
jgi:hypothetical protein